MVDAPSGAAGKGGVRMDVKEAITQLTGLKKYCEGMAECDESGSYVFDLDVQALDMAITALSPPNEPLTIEQLREMDGEPVWCKWLLPEDRAIEQGKWFIVISGDKAGLEIKRPAEYGCHFCKIDDYGKTWLAYRRPPEGEVDT